MGDKAIRVLLVDDHALVRTGIRKILEAVPDIDVVGEADSGEAGVELTRRLAPDVVLMDKHMPGIGGVEAMRRILALKQAKVICLTVDTVGPLPRRILEMGVMGFLTKACRPEEMIEGVRRVHAGERYLDVEIARLLADQSLTGGSRSPFDSLSSRELQVCMLLAKGYSSQKISTMLSLSPKTVSTYRARVLQKSGCDNLVDLIRKAIRFGLMETEPDTRHA